MEFSGGYHSTTGGITSSTLLPFGLWAPAFTEYTNLNFQSNVKDALIPEPTFGKLYGILPSLQFHGCLLIQLMYIHV